jgi:hypothetical protein
MGNAEVRRPSSSIIRTDASGGADSLANTCADRASIRPITTRDRRVRCRLERVTRVMEGGPRAEVATHTITCRCCETTAQVPLCRRFLCDACFHDGPGLRADEGF